MSIFANLWPLLIKLRKKGVSGAALQSGRSYGVRGHGCRCPSGASAPAISVSLQGPQHPPHRCAGSRARDNSFVNAPMRSPAPIPTPRSSVGAASWSRRRSGGVRDGGSAAGRGEPGRSARLCSSPTSVSPSPSVASSTPMVLSL
jgi:hypothetical protein